MDYKQYTVEDFVLDQRFRKWVLQADEEDHLYWEEWLKKHPHCSHKVAEAHSIIKQWPKTDHLFTKTAKDNLWQSILEDTGENRKTSEKSGQVIPLYTTGTARARLPRSRRSYWLDWRVAGMISILLVISFLILNQEKVVTGPGTEKIVKENPLGQKSKIFLPDGSEVILNSGSKMTYSNTYGKTDRNIYLEGEAFFKVAENGDLPFKVTANGLLTIALGTSFNITAFKDQGMTKVALVTGKVVVKNCTAKQKDAMDTLMLVPGQQAILSLGADKSLSKSTYDLKQVTGWKDGIIVFRDAGAKVVFSYLEKWYGVHITTVNTSSKQWAYTGEFENMSLHGVLTSIGFTMDFKFAIEGDHISIEYF